VLTQPPNKTAIVNASEAPPTKAPWRCDRQACAAGKFDNDRARSATSPRPGYSTRRNENSVLVAFLASHLVRGETNGSSSLIAQAAFRRPVPSSRSPSPRSATLFSGSMGMLEVRRPYLKARASEAAWALGEARTIVSPRHEMRRQKPTKTLFSFRRVLYSWRGLWPIGHGVVEFSRGTRLTVTPHMGPSLVGLTGVHDGCFVRWLRPTTCCIPPESNRVPLFKSQAGLRANMTSLQRVRPCSSSRMSSDGPPIGQISAAIVGGFPRIKGFLQAAVGASEFPTLDGY